MLNNKCFYGWNILKRVRTNPPIMFLVVCVAALHLERGARSVHSYDVALTQKYKSTSWGTQRQFLHHTKNQLNIMLLVTEIRRVLQISPSSVYDFMGQLDGWKEHDFSNGAATVTTCFNISGDLVSLHLYVLEFLTTKQKLWRRKFKLFLSSVVMSYTSQTSAGRTEK